ncbi:MAG: hypothetical protein KY449_05545, partial [Proteobacteria bacterium]|nr:hypothetical protein [Pseudomonadota bacterium]
MPPFDPRREPVRFAPTLTVMAVAICAAGMTMAAKAEPTGAKRAKAAVEASQSGTAKADKTKTDKAASSKAGTKGGEAKSSKTAKAGKSDAGKPAKTEGTK